MRGPPGGWVLGIVAGTEQFSPGLVEALGGLIVAHGLGDIIELFEGDAIDRADELEPGDLVAEIDVVAALDAVEIALVDGIGPQKARASIATAFAPCADIDVSSRKYRAGVG